MTNSAGSSLFSIIIFQFCSSNIAVAIPPIPALAGQPIDGRWILAENFTFTVFRHSETRAWDVTFGSSFLDMLIPNMERHELFVPPTLLLDVESVQADGQPTDVAYLPFDIVSFFLFLL